MDDQASDRIKTASFKMGGPDPLRLKLNLAQLTDNKHVAQTGNNSLNHTLKTSVKDQLAKTERSHYDFRRYGINNFEPTSDNQQSMRTGGSNQKNGHLVFPYKKS